MPDTAQTNTYTEAHQLEMDQSSGGTWVNLPSASTDKLKELRKTLINDIVTGKICIFKQEASHE